MCTSTLAGNKAASSDEHDAEVPGGAAIVREVDRCEAILVPMENAANASYARPQQAASLSSLATQGEDILKS